MTRMTIKFLAMAMIVLTGTLLLQAQDMSSSLKITGQIRMRSEMDDRDFNGDTRANDFTLLRSRINFTGAFTDKIVAFVQLQDSRLFGGEDTSGATGTLKNTANVDMRLGYVQINRLFWRGLNFKFGRMEFARGSERLLGSNPWSNVSRAFDGGVLSLVFRRFQIDLMHVTLYESNRVENTTDGDQALSGMWTTARLSDLNVLELYALKDTDQQIDADARNKMERVTLGSRFKGKLGQMDIESEFNWQTGTMNYSRDISAFYITQSFGYTLPTALKPNIKLAFDYLSGDKSDTDAYECFNTLYPATHRYFGYMDYFKDIPRHTRDLGLRDWMVMTKFELMKNLSLKLDGHYFQLAQVAVLEDGARSRHMGAEIDLTLDFTYRENVQFKLGGSVFLPDAVYDEWKGGDPSYWFFGQTTVDF